MFHLSENSSLRGSGHLVLNILRAFNIISLLTVAAASWVMIVMTSMTNGFFFFDGAAHFFTSSIALFLIVSELNLFKGYFERNWPVLSPQHGLSWLGIAMLVMGCQTLGNLNKSATSPAKIGLPMWRLILAAGILAITFAFLNIVSSIVFRDGSNGITSRHIRTDGSLASGKSFTDAYSTRSNSIKDEKSSKKWAKRFTLSSRPKISKPIIQHNVDEEAQWQEDRHSPIMPNVQRPATALHPMNKRMNRYSEASHIARF